jgi:tetratricopeptide (TPR) repeat protein
LPNQVAPIVDGLFFLLARPCWRLLQYRVTKRYNRAVRIRSLIVSLALLTALSGAQDATDKAAADKPTPDKSSSEKTTSDKSDAAKQAERNAEAGESSSSDTRIDLSAPKDDAKNHPGSQAAVADLDGSENPDTTGVQEFHPWYPLKSKRDIDVGDFYFRRKNYKAALDRYKEALYYKDGDAVASFRIAECEEKLGDKTEARKYYEQYLKILPEGPLAKDAHSSLDRMAKAQ